MNISAKYLGPLSSVTFTTGTVLRGGSINIPVDVAAELALDAPKSWDVPDNVKARAEVIKGEREKTRRELNNLDEDGNPKPRKSPYAPAKKLAKAKA